MWELCLFTLILFITFCLLLEANFLLKLKIFLLKAKKITRWTPKYNRLPFYIKKLLD